MSRELLKQCYDELSKLNGLVVKSEGVDCKFDDLLNELSKEILKKPVTIEEWFSEWGNLVIELSEKETELSSLKDEYNQKEFDIVFLNSDNVDFKEMYGSTSEKVRKQHAQMKLQSMADSKTDLELSIDYLKRRIEFIKGLMSMQRVLIGSGVFDNDL